ncbi:hypothetical protein JYP51_14220 [Ponticoccus gilvus]|nr:hypothetical protein [Enemella evansiae]
MRAGRCEQRVSGQRGLSGRRRCNDTLIGGQANDTLYGGAGSDRFEFQTSMGDDTIGDFDELNNEVRLDGFTGIGNDAQALATASGGGTVPITLDFGAQGTLTFNTVFDADDLYGVFDWS